MHKIHSIVLVSGGMDSLVSLALTIEKLEKKGLKAENIAALHLNYRQKTQARELKAFYDICAFYHIRKSFQKVLDLGFLGEIGGSSLTSDSIAVSRYNPEHLGKIVPTSYVPFRNTIILSLAVSWAEVLGASELVIGAVFEDSSGYPDCRPSFYDAFSQTIKEGTQYGPISLSTPVIYFNKKQIVEEGIRLKVPFILSWSCYAKEDKACGVCDSCFLRLRGFKEALIKDPIEYEVLE